MAVDAVDCFEGTNGNISVIAAGGTDEFTYAWSNGMTEAMITDLESGTYEVTVTDSDGCTNVEDVEVAEAALIVLDVSLEPISCFGETDGTVSITPSGGTGTMTFEWNDGTTDSSLSDLGEGSYTVTITDENNCQQTDNIVLSEPAQISLESELDSVDCFGAMSGSIAISPSGGTGDFDYLWSNGDTESTTSDLTAGNYDVTITDANNCELMESFVLFEAAQITLESEVESVDCFGAMSGSITLIPSGGTGDFNYLWSNGDTESTIGDLTSGDYDVTITDANNCDLIESFSLDQAPALDIASTSSNPSSSLAGSISVSASGGTMPYSILWDDGADTFELTDLMAGSYTYTITDANGCTFEETVVLDFINALNNPDDYSLSIYPNPTKGMVYIKSDLTEMTLVVYDLLGRPLRSFEKDGAADLWSVDLSGLSPGLYCLKIGSGEVEILEMVVIE